MSKITSGQQNILDAIDRYEYVRVSVDWNTGHRFVFHGHGPTDLDGRSLDALIRKGLIEPIGRPHPDHDWRWAKYRRSEETT